MTLSNDQYNAALNNHIVHAIGLAFNDLDSTSTKAPSQFFITVMFKEGSVPIQHASSAVFSRFSNLYNATCEALLGKNSHRPNVARLRPVVAAFLDAEGSRYANRLVALSNAHIHSIWAVHPDQVQSFIESFESPKVMMTRGRYEIDKIDIRPVARLDDLRTVTSYSTKLLRYNRFSLDAGADFEFYPKGQNGH